MTGRADEMLQMSARDPESENPTAGEGPVVLDIGGDVGALIVVMPADMVGLEVEIVPTGTAGARAHNHAHEHGKGHDHPHDHGDEVGAVHPPHVAVVARVLPDGGVVPSLVFGALAAGRYDLYVRPDGPVRLTAQVTGGEITETTWPEVLIGPR